MHTDIILGFIGVAAAVFGGQGFWTWLSYRGRKKSSEARLLMGIGYSKIVQQSEGYIRQGYIPTDEYHELYHYLYEPYKAMGGNGTAERLMEQVKKLPSAEKEVKS